ncbi:MAG: response regulator transcription factor [Anaerolineales bacterium]
MELILVIDHEFPTQRLVRDHLEQADYRVLTASDAETGMRMLRRESPDLLVLDASLPQQNGLELARAIRLDRELSCLPILLLAPQANDHLRSGSLELGVDYYVTRPFDPRELIQRVRTLLRLSKNGKPAPTRISRGDLTLDLCGRRLLRRDEPVELTPAEFSLLSTFMEKPGHIFTRRELLQAALGQCSENASRTLDTHIRNLRHKIEDNPHQPVYIQTVHRVGYRFGWLGGQVT